MAAAIGGASWGAPGAAGSRDGMMASAGRACQAQPPGVHGPMEEGAGAPGAAAAWRLCAHAAAMRLRDAAHAPCLHAGATKPVGSEANASKQSEHARHNHGGKVHGGRRKST